MGNKRQHRSGDKPNHASAAIAVEAGRIMAEEGIVDFRIAKLKARERLRLPKDAPLPSNQEVRLACDAHLSLFTPEEQLLSRRLSMMKDASAAMAFFRDFNPKLVVEFLHHPIASETPIELHLEATNPEAIAHFLQQHRIPFEQTENQTRFGPNDTSLVPAFRFEDDQQKYVLLAFSRTLMRKTPKNLAGSGPLARMSQSETDKWLSRSI